MLHDGELLCQTRLQLAQMANIAQAQFCQQWHMLTLLQKHKKNEAGTHRDSALAIHKGDCSSTSGLTGDS